MLGCCCWPDGALLVVLEAKDPKILLVPPAVPPGAGAAVEAGLVVPVDVPNAGVGFAVEAVAPNPPNGLDCC